MFHPGQLGERMMDVFEWLVSALTRTTPIAFEPKPRKLAVASEVSTFIRPSLRFRDGDDEGPVDVVLIEAPAAVGKSTMARWLSHTARAPLLDLAVMPVGIGSFAGLLPDVTSGSHHVRGDDAILDGLHSVIIDAVDEGFMLSGEGGLYAFLESTWGMLLERRERESPALVILGRPEAIEDTYVSLQAYGDGLLSRRLTVDLFARDAAREMIHAYMRVAAASNNTQAQVVPTLKPYLDLIDAYFESFAEAMGVEVGSLWDEPEAQQFVGYAPVLEMLGTITGASKQPAAELSAVRRTTTESAWSVVENVCSLVFDRERAKFTEPLVQSLREDGLLKGDLPDGAFSRDQQVRAIIALLVGDAVEDKLPDVFGAEEADAETHYRKLCARQIRNHPFVRLDPPQFSSSVLGSIVIADAIVGGLESVAVNVGSFEHLGRQKFLWQAVEHRSKPGAYLDGDNLDIITSSFATSASGDRLHVLPDEDEEGWLALSLVKAARPVRQHLFGISPPVRLGPRIKDVVVDAPEVALRGSTRSLEIAGNVAIRAGTLTIQSSDQTLFVSNSNNWLECSQIVGSVGDIQLRKDAGGEDAEIRFEGVLRTTFPWRDIRTAPVPEPFGTGDGLVANPVVALLLKMAERYQNAGMVVTLACEVADDNLDWFIKAAGGKEPSARVLRALRNHGLTSEHHLPSSGEAKIRLRLQFDLQDYAERIAQGDPKLMGIAEDLTRAIG